MPEENVKNMINHLCLLVWPDFHSASRLFNAQNLRKTVHWIHNKFFLSCNRCKYFPRRWYPWQRSLLLRRLDLTGQPVVQTQTPQSDQRCIVGKTKRHSWDEHIVCNNGTDEFGWVQVVGSWRESEMDAHQRRLWGKYFPTSNR